MMTNGAGVEAERALRGLPDLWDGAEDEYLDTVGSTTQTASSGRFGTEVAGTPALKTVAGRLDRLRARINAASPESEAFKKWLTQRVAMADVSESANADEYMRITGAQPAVHHSRLDRMRKRIGRAGGHGLAERLTRPTQWDNRAVNEGELTNASSSDNNSISGNNGSAARPTVWDVAPSTTVGSYAVGVGSANVHKATLHTQIYPATTNGGGASEEYLDCAGHDNVPQRARRGADEGRNDEYLGLGEGIDGPAGMARRQTQGSVSSEEYMAVYNDGHRRLSTASARLEATQLRASSVSASSDSVSSFFGMREKVVHGNVQLEPGNGGGSGRSGSIAFPTNGYHDGSVSTPMQHAHPLVVLPTPARAEAAGRGVVYTAHRRTQPTIDVNIDVAPENDFRVSKFFPELAEEEAEMAAASVAVGAKEGATLQAPRSGLESTVFGATLGSNRTFGARPSGRERATRLQAMFTPSKESQNTQLGPISETQMKGSP